MVNNTRDLLQVEVDNNNRLIINFTQHFGYECVVTITSWAKGISWSGVADTEDQRMSALSDLGYLLRRLMEQKMRPHGYQLFQKGYKMS